MEYQNRDIAAIEISKSALIVSKARIRTIRAALNFIKGVDSGTAVTYNFVRRLCDSGAIGTIMAGKKILINLDELLQYLNLGVNYGYNS